MPQKQSITKEELLDLLAGAAAEEIDRITLPLSPIFPNEPSPSIQEVIVRHMKPLLGLIG